MVFDSGLLLGKLGSTSLGTSEYSSIVSMNLFVALLCACIVIGHLLEENRWMNESITALVIVLIKARNNNVSLRKESASEPKDSPDGQIAA